MSENFVSRWARLKRQSDAQHRPEPAGDGPPVNAVAAIEAEAISGHAQDREIVAEPFDPASLPSIETITIDTDIRGFLQSRVPVELTRAALRRAWTSDPAIRDFIGIAENQWDFNDPHAMPGFGPLQGSDNLAALLGRAPGSRDDIVEFVPVPASVGRSSPVAADCKGMAFDGPSDQAFAGAPRTNQFSGGPGVDPEVDEGGREGVTEGFELPRQLRPHGGALPR